MKLVLASLLIASTAFAQAKPDKQLAADDYADGQKDFLAGDYLPAAAKFEAAYALDPDPVYLYNAAQAYRKGSACARAAENYRKFLEIVPNPPNLDKVTNYIDELDACAKADSAPEVVTPPPAPVVPTPPPPAPIQPPSPAPVLITRERPNAALERQFGIGLGAGGLVLVAVGVAFTHDVRTLEGYSAALCNSCTWNADKQQRSEDLQRRGDRDSKLSFASYAVGGAALISGFVLHAFGSRAPETFFEPAHGGGGSVVTRFSF
jgi:tetratricopeptide (TPR) repeat protein